MGHVGVVATARASRTKTTSKGRTRDPDEKRLKIVEAATQLFSEHGYTDTTTAQIAKAAGVSQGIVFHHFGSKQGVLNEVAAEYGRGVAMAMFEGVLPGQRPDTDAMLRRVFEHARSQGTLHACFGINPDPETPNSAISQTRKVIIGALSAAFESWADQGIIVTHRPKIAASLLFGLVEYALFECFVSGDGEDWEAYHAEAVHLVNHALQFDPDAE